MKKAQIELKNGKIMNLNLDDENAPISVENFIKYVNDGFYNGVIFHRVIPSFMIQGGGFTDDGEGLKNKPATYKEIKGEFASNGVNNPIKHKVGTISMARTFIKNSATSQFFICVADCGYLDGEYAAFGALSDEESIKVAREISEVRTHAWRGYEDIPNDPIVIKSIKILD
jgi:peptidyl-prolyl cis-trans isomerase B (cyclophilin B)